MCRHRCTRSSTVYMCVVHSVYVVCSLFMQIFVCVIRSNMRTNVHNKYYIFSYFICWKFSCRWFRYLMLLFLFVCEYLFSSFRFSFVTPFHYTHMDLFTCSIRWHLFAAIHLDFFFPFLLACNCCRCRLPFVRDVTTLPRAREISIVCLFRNVQ